MSESPTTSMQRFAARLGRFGLIYGVGAGGVILIGLVQAVAITHFLTPEEFGRLAVLLAFGGAFTLLPMLATLQGTLGRVFGSTGDDEAPDPSADGPGESTDDSGLSLMTGTLVMVMVSAVLVAVAWPFAGQISDMLLGTDDYAREVRLSILAGVLAAPFRLLLLFPRYGRRGRRFVAMEVGRLVLIIAVMLPLLAAGEGISGAVTGIVIGEALALLGAIALTRKDLTFSFSAKEARVIFRIGVVMAPVLIAHYVIFNVDIFILNAYVGPAEVGEYRLAATFGQFIAQPVSVFLMAWGPLSRSPLQHAAERERSKAFLAEKVLRYAWITGLGLLLGTALYADHLVQLSPETYAAAASLVPLLGCGFVLRALFVILYRTSLFDGKRTLFIALNGVAAIVFLVAAFALIPLIGGVGAATARAAAYLTALVVILVVSQMSSKPLPIKWLALAGAGAAALLSYEAGHYAGMWVAPATLVGPALYVSLVIGLGIVPRGHMGLVVESAAGLRPRRPTQGIEDRLGAMSATDLSLLRQVFREKGSTAAQLNGEVDSKELATRLSVALDGLAGLPGDLAIGPAAVPYALSYDRIAQHDRIGSKLAAEGVDPVVLDAIDETVRAIKMVPRRRWPAPPV